jgi:pyruvate dehydrogenase E2 component (dihydrolipoamide acetyltransferase)
MAREQGVDLRSVAGSGPRGRVIKRDLEGLPKAAAKTAAAKANAPAKGAVAGAGSWERLPARSEKASSTRKTIARRLSESKRDVPHYYLTVDLDVDALNAARTQLNDRAGGRRPRCRSTTWSSRPARSRCGDVPECNASWGGDVIHFHQVVDISVAVAVPDGLITPVVRDADKKSVRAIAEEVRALAGRAKDKKLRLDEITDGTFSISNLGMYGIEEFAAVINPPEGAILAVGRGARGARGACRPGRPRAPDEGDLERRPPGHRRGRGGSLPPGLARLFGAAHHHAALKMHTVPGTH